MKKIILLIVLFLINYHISAQGWMSNSSTNSIYSINSGLNLNPVNIGIGITNPQDRLHIFNSGGYQGLTIDGVNNAQSRLVFSNQGAPTTVLYRPISSNNFGIWNQIKSEDMMYFNTATSNIGIGTISPSEQIHSTRGVRFEGLTNNDSHNRVLVQDNSGKLFWRNSSTIGNQNSWNLTGNSNTNPSLNFLGTTDLNRLVFRTNNTEKATILENGNVGIATNAPESKLHLHEGMLRIDGGVDSAQLDSSSFWNGGPFSGLHLRNQTDIFGLLIQNYPGYFDRNDAVVYWGDNHAENLKFCTADWDQSNNTYNFVEKVRISAQGFLGVNTNNPAAFLDINGNAKISDLPAKQSQDRLVFADADGELHSLMPGTNNSFLRGDGTWAPIPSGSSLVNNCNTVNYIPRLTSSNTFDCGSLFDNGSSVGLGSTSFSYSTFPSSSVLTGASIPSSRGNYKLSVQGPVRAQAYWAYSDKTLKTDIENLKDVNKIILQLDGKKYRWTEKFQQEANIDNGYHYGFIAQEVEKVVPESVIKDENGVYAVDYTSFIPILVESQKSLIQENKELNQKVEILIQELSKLKDQMKKFDNQEDVKANTNVDLLFNSIPNPTDKIALIGYHLAKNYNEATISVYGINGNEIENIKLTPTAGDNSIKLNVENYANGIYIYSLVVDGQKIDSKKLEVFK